MRFAAGLFRTHVRQSSDELSVRALANVFVAKGDPKISDVGLPFLINQDVFRFDVSVDQSLGVSIVECLGDDGDELCRLGMRQPILPSSVPQIRPLDDLGHDEAQAVRRAPHVMHRNDVRVVQPGEDAGLSQVGLCIGNSLWMRNLDGDTALQVFVIAQVHRGKAAAAKDSLNSVTPDPLGNGDLLKDRRLALGLGRALGGPRFRQFRRLELRSERLVRGGIARRSHWPPGPSLTRLSNDSETTFWPAPMGDARCGARTGICRELPPPICEHRANPTTFRGLSVRGAFLFAGRYSGEQAG